MCHNNDVRLTAILSPVRVPVVGLARISNSCLAWDLSMRELICVSLLENCSGMDGGRKRRQKTIQTV